MNFNRDESKRPVVAIDVDGVCVKWQSGLPYYLAKHALPTQNALKCILTEEFMSPAQLFGCDDRIARIFMKDYNKSNFIKYLAPYQDALEMINRMKDKWDFVAVTALGKDKETVMNRLFNLNALFPGAFKDIFVCDFGESKVEILTQVKTKYDNVVMFIDDVASNIEAAHEVMPDVPRYYINRGPRPKCEVPHFAAKDLNEVCHHYVVNIPLPKVAVTTYNY